MSRRYVSLVTVSALSLATAAAAQSGGAGMSAPPAAGANATIAAVDEIVVTAEKRSERLTDVPMSITAASGLQLQEAGVTQVADLQKLVPGFTYQPSTTQTPVYSLRGIGFYTNTVTVAPTVGVYVDQVPLPFSSMARGVSLDLERVEVLKGPQGTLFGENSTGGAINFIAAKPTDHFTAGAQVGYGTFDAVNAEAFVSGPLSDTVTARVAIATDQRSNWQRSESRPGDTLGKRDFTDGRILVDWKPTDQLRFEVSLNGWIDKSDTQASQFLSFVPALPSPPGYADLYPGLAAYAVAHPPTNDARAADWVAGTSYRKDDSFYQGAVRADWDIGAATLTSVTAYSGLKVRDPVSLGGSNLPELDVLSKASIHTISQELRLAGKAADDRLDWLVGGNFEMDYAHESQIGFNYDSSNSGVGPFRYHSFQIDNNQNIQTLAAFGSLSYTLTNTLTVQGSARYTQSNNSFRGCLRDPGDGNIAAGITFLAHLANPAAVNPGAGNCVTLNPATFNFLPVVTNELNQNNVSWRVSANWKPDARSLIYANVTKGFKAGAFNDLPAVFSTQLTPVTQESLLAYEVGFKRDFHDPALQLTGAAFYYDYSNKQILGIISEPIFGALPGLVTVPKSDVLGGEVNLIWRPAHNLTLTAGATYVHSKVTKDFVTPDEFGTPTNVRGEAFPNSPRWQAVADVRYGFHVADGVEAYVGATPQYVSSNYSAFGTSAMFKVPGHTLLDLRAGITRGRLGVEVFGRNVTDVFYPISIIRFSDTVSRLNGLPATVGINLSYSLK